MNKELQTVIQMIEGKIEILEQDLSKPLMFASKFAMEMSIKELKLVLDFAFAVTDEKESKK